LIRFGVTGTDTSVGKTVIAAGIVAWLRQRGFNAVGMKPIETGGSSADAELLFEASGKSAKLTEIWPVHFDAALAPAVAARLEGTQVSLSDLDDAFAHLSLGRDVIVVEGAGGILVPIQGATTFADLFRKWQLQTVIVAANRLGTINHTLLTAAAAKANGLQMVAVVLNDVGHGADDVSVGSNAAAIADLLPGVPVISFPRMDDARDISEIASHVGSSGLGDLLGL
jgi:dethiobiotin synthetase